MKPSPKETPPSAADTGSPRGAPSLLKTVRHILSDEGAKRHPVSTALRLLTWQAWRRILGRPMAFRTVTGTRLLLLPGASDSLSGFWYYELPDYEELSFTLHLLGPSDLFIDVGANQGGWSLTAAGTGARVIAFEPIPLTFQRLQANLAANATEIRNRVQAMPFAVGESPGKAVFTSTLDAGNHLLRDGEAPPGGCIEVEVGRLDDLLGNESPTLIKIDVEGEELGVLRGGPKVLARSTLSAVIVETFRPHNFALPSLIAVEALLRDAGFQPMQYRPQTRELRPLEKPSDGSQNTIYVRDAQSVLKRLKAERTPAATGAIA